MTESAVSVAGAGAPGWPLRGTIHLPGPVDLGLTLGPLQHGAYDPTIRFERDRVWVALRMPGGPAATLLFAGRGSTVEVAAWGPGSEAALDAAPGLLGAFDEPARLEARDRAVRELVRHLPGLRMTRTRRVMDALVPAILEQKVTGLEAQRAWRRIIRVWGTWAPAPRGCDCRPRPPSSPRGRTTTTTRSGSRRGARTSSGPCAGAREQLERLVDCDGDTARRRLCSIPGIGPWTPRR
jgi:hypothetical protein